MGGDLGMCFWLAARRPNTGTSDYRYNGDDDGGDDGDDDDNDDDDDDGDRDGRDDDE